MLQEVPYEQDRLHDKQDRLKEKQDQMNDEQYMLQVDHCRL
jgi:hypothetical protein